MSKADSIQSRGDEAHETSLLRSARYGATVAVLSVLALAGCDRELILPGDRFDVRTPLADTNDPANSLGDATVEADETAELVAEVEREAVAIRLPATRNLTSWTHRNGSNQHRTEHPALAPSLTEVWRTGIGAGDSRKHRITASPVAGGGRIYTLDSRAKVTGMDLATGDIVWQRDLSPPRDRSDDASGGGLTLGGDTLYVTSAFGTITALDAASGNVKWTQALDAPANAAPTVDGNRVYVVSTDAVARAIDTRTGKVEWLLAGAPNVSSLTGGAGPIIDGRNVVLPLPSGELISVLKQTGIRVWGTSVAGERVGRAYSIFSGITGDPVLVGNTIYTSSPQGKTVAIDAETGDREWTANEGAYGPVWPVGGSLFLISDEARLVRLNARTGEAVWAEQLPYFEHSRPRRHREIHAHFGPILAGGRLLVASDDGLMRSFDPASGAQVSSTEIPGGAATAPIVINGTAYVVSTNGILYAFR